MFSELSVPSALCCEEEAIEASLQASSARRSVHENSPQNLPPPTLLRDQLLIHFTERLPPPRCQTFPGGGGERHAFQVPPSEVWNRFAASLAERRFPTFHVQLDRTSRSTPPKKGVLTISDY